MLNFECNHIRNSTGDWLLHTMGFNRFPFSSFCQFFASVRFNSLYRMIECHIIPNVDILNTKLHHEKTYYSLNAHFFSSLWPIIKIHISQLEPETYHIIIQICAINNIHKYGTNFCSFICFHHGTGCKLLTNTIECSQTCKRRHRDPIETPLNKDKTCVK